MAVVVNVATPLAPTGAVLVRSPPFRKNETVPPTNGAGEFVAVTTTENCTAWPKNDPPNGLDVTEDVGVDTCVNACVTVRPDSVAGLAR